MRFKPIIISVVAIAAIVGVAAFFYNKNINTEQPKAKLVKSLDFGGEDAERLERAAILISGENPSNELLAYNEMVMLNRVWTADKFGKDIPEEVETLCQLYGMTVDDFNKIKITRRSVEAMTMIIFDKWDKTEQSTIYRFPRR